MVLRWVAAVFVLTTGCVGINPDYRDAAADAESTTTGDAKSGTTTGPSAKTTTGPDATSMADATASSHGTETEPNPGTTGPVFDLGASDDSETGSTTVNVAWLTEFIQGDFGTNDEVLCVAPPNSTGARCFGDAVLLVGRAATPLQALPLENPFLSEGPFFAAGYAEQVIDDYAAFTTGAVAPPFVEALSGNAKQTELSLWWGPITDGDPPSCEDWNATKGSATVFAFVSGDASGSMGDAMCSSSRRALCACRGTL